MSSDWYQEWENICAEVEAAQRAVVDALCPNGTTNPSEGQIDALLEAKQRRDAAWAKESAFIKRYRESR
ncbi:hypothetical protein LGM38_17730 [Burkholderia vietnamiensis]|uniref:hypothetical protein n=1 Tax=Burkholderia vietnamiensis TaxID=60552 RepID=UPI001CF2CDF8|nr:hypothetical protein [Burkholderia vietnamiensis]MCA8013889.1 hypothetical protein [Burkholderia vietnamiensis]HDR8937054.1 hypothetical protein [Burkholderia vietnamiensis]HDR9260541.1 hypothetical protein [Burkholderia vietnamiensis]